MSQLDVRPINKLLVPQVPIFDDFEWPEDCPVDIEIGCGVGFHPLHYIKRHPNRFLIAIERTTFRSERAFHRLRDHENKFGAIDNLHLINADAVSWVVHNVPEESVDKYFFLYPNPYPKTKHLNRRWHAMPFMHTVLETLVPGGTITVATNMPAYHQEALEYYQNYWKLSVVEDRQIDSAELPRTHFEKKYLRRGHACFNLVLRKD